MTELDDAGPDDGTPEGGAPDSGTPDSGTPVDAAAFWRLGPLPRATPAEPAPWLEQVGRPEISVDGRNLADVLAPLYAALARQEAD